MMVDQEIIFNAVTEVPQTVSEIADHVYPTKSYTERRALYNRVYKNLKHLEGNGRICSGKAPLGPYRTIDVYCIGQVQDRCILIEVDRDILSNLSGEFRTTAEITKSLFTQPTDTNLHQIRQRLVRLEKRGFVESSKGKNYRAWRLKA